MCCAAIPHRYVQAVLLFEQVQNALKKIEHAFEDARPSMNREKKRCKAFYFTTIGMFVIRMRTVLENRCLFRMMPCSPSTARQMPEAG